MKYSLLALSLAVVLSVGCASKNKVEKPDTKPVKLVKLEQNQVKLNQIKQYQVEGTEKDNLRLRIQSENGVDFVANPNGMVSAYRGKQRVWQTQLAKKIPLTAGVEVADGVVIVANAKGEIFALNQQDGTIVWQTQVPSSIIAPSLIIQERVITIANDGEVYAHDVKNGQRLWSYKLPHSQFSLRGQATPVAVDGRSVLLGTTNGYVFIIDSVSGMPIVQRRVAVSGGKSEISRLLDVDGEAQIIGSTMVSTAYQGQVTATDLNTQSILWSVDASSSKAPASDGDSVFVSQSNGKLAAYNLASGRQLWENESLLRRQLSNPVVFGNTVVVGDLDGILHIIDPDTGKLIGREKTKGAISYLYVDDGKLYVSTKKGTFSVWTN